MLNFGRPIVKYTPNIQKVPTPSPSGPAPSYNSLTTPSQPTTTPHTNNPESHLAHPGRGAYLLPWQPVGLQHTERHATLDTATARTPSVRRQRTVRGGLPQPAGACSSHPLGWSTRFGLPLAPEVLEWLPAPEVLEWLAACLPLKNGWLPACLWSTGHSTSRQANSTLSGAHSQLLLPS